jgi:hypothetical protein
MGAPTVKVSRTKEALFGVGSQTVKCDVGTVAVSGAAITSKATGKHDIMGTVGKIN